MSVDDSHHSEELAIAWVGDGWVVAYQTWIEDLCSEVRLQKLDPSGNRVGGPVWISGGVGALLSVEDLGLVWTGAELLVTWTEAPTSPDCFDYTGHFHAQFQRVNPALQPLGLKTRLDCIPPYFGASGYPRAAWAGNRYGVAWGESPPSPLKFTTISRDGDPADVCGLGVTGTLPKGRRSLAWNGSWYGLAWSECLDEVECGNSVFDEIYFRRIGEDMSLPDPEPIRQTYEPKRSQVPSVIWADGEWGIGWADFRTSALDLAEIFFMRLDPDGNKLDPPGDVRITCCNTDVSGFSRYFPDLDWTGEEYGLVYHEKNHAYSTTGDVFFQRINKQGANLGGPLLVTDNPAKDAGHLDMAWNGTLYGVAYVDSMAGVARQVFLRRVGCNCTDVDNDGFTTCAGADCDDGNAQINPSRSESCTDGLDNNCDTLRDCQDTAGCPAQSGPIPGEVLNVQFASDEQTLSWDAEPKSSLYDILWGDVSELRLDEGYGRAACRVWRLAATSFQEPQPPAAGRVNYYLVRGKKDRCKLGTWGTALRDQATYVCP